MEKKSKRVDWAMNFRESMECPECGAIMFPETADQSQFSCSSGTCLTEVKMTKSNIVISGRSENKPRMQEVLVMRPSSSNNSYL